MKVLSLFSGIGGFDLGLERAGMEIVAQVEIDPQCRELLARRCPGARRIEDVRNVGLHVAGGWGHLANERDGHHADAPSTTASGGVASSPNALGAGSGTQREGRGGSIDLICGGFPCQDVSVAGRRAGLQGERSGLWHEFQRVLLELRPRWAVIENVPGLLSSNQGRDFAVILEGLEQCGFGGIAWAVLDAQHFGVAQRRRRVFIVAGPSSRSAEAVLAICESCGGHPQAGRTQRKDVALALKAGAGRSGPKGADHETYIPEVSHPINARDGKGVNQREDVMTYVVQQNDGGTHKRKDRPEGGLYVNETDTALTVGTTDLTAIADAMSVRRLTPTECERLQGFPDGWTEGFSDGTRYRMLGNAVAVPVAEWLGLRIMAAEEGA